MKIIETGGPEKPEREFQEDNHSHEEHLRFATTAV